MTSLTASRFFSWKKKKLFLSISTRLMYLQTSLIVKLVSLLCFPRLQLTQPHVHSGTFASKNSPAIAKCYTVRLGGNGPEGALRKSKQQRGFCRENQSTHMTEAYVNVRSMTPPASTHKEEEGRDEGSRSRKRHWQECINSVSSYRAARQNGYDWNDSQLGYQLLYCSGAKMEQLVQTGPFN